MPRALLHTRRRNVGTGNGGEPRFVDLAYARREWQADHANCFQTSSVKARQIDDELSSLTDVACVVASNIGRERNVYRLMVDAGAGSVGRSVDAALTVESCDHGEA